MALLAATILDALVTPTSLADEPVVGALYALAVPFGLVLTSALWLGGERRVWLCGVALAGVSAAASMSAHPIALLADLGFIAIAVLARVGKRCWPLGSARSS